MNTTDENLINVTITCADAGVPSGCCDADGAIDFTVDVVIDGNTLTQVGVTLIPDPANRSRYGYPLEAWGNLDHWLEDRGVQLVRYLGDAGHDLAREIVAVCRIAHRDGRCTSTIEIDAGVIDDHADEVAADDVADFVRENPDTPLVCAPAPRGAITRVVADILGVPTVLHHLWLTAYDRAARRAVALRLVADEDAAAEVAS